MAEIREPINFSDGSVTITFWVKPSNRTQSENEVFELLAAESNPQDAWPRMRFNGPAPERQIRWRVWGDSEDKVDGIEAPKTDWDPDQWYHIALKVSPVPGSDGVWQQVVFVDGRPQRFADQGFTPDLNNGGFSLGNSNASIGFGGVIDDFRIYDRALSAEEISRIMDGSS